MALKTATDIKEAFDKAQEYMQQYFKPFNEFERLARNKPHASVLRAKLPNVTDGSLAAAIRSQPRRIIQQLPTGRVTSVDQAELSAIVDFLWTNQILPNATTNGDPLQKWWIAATKAKTYGSQPIYSFFKNDGEYYGADFVLPYVRDVFPEPGKLNANDSNVVFMQTWWSKGDIEALIERETKLGKSAKGRKEKYEGNLDVQKLRSLITKMEAKPEAAKTPAEKKDSQTQYVRLVKIFQKGIGGTFYTYAPLTNEIVGSKPNKDPRGCIPVKWLYDDIDLSNPLGFGAIELAGGMQNLIDGQVQSYQFVEKINMAPPVRKWGTAIVNTSIKWKPFAVWDMGSDPNSKIEPVELNNQAIASFSTNYGLMKSQLLNLIGAQDTSISSAAGNPSFSKTQAGVKANESRVSTDDNYFRKQFEATFQLVAEDMLNIHFAESDGTREIELTEEYLETQKQTSEKSPADNKIVKVDPERKQAIIAYNLIKTKVKFSVNPSSTKSPDDAEQVSKLQEILQDAGQSKFVSYFLSQDGYQLHLGEAYVQLFQRLGVENIEKIVTKMPPEQKDAAKQEPFPVIDMPKVTIAFDDLPMGAQLSAMQNAGIQPDQQTEQELQQLWQAKLAKAMPAQAPEKAAAQPKSPIESMAYKDVPEDVKRQMEQAAGFQPSQSLSPAGSQQFEAHAGAMTQAAMPQQPAQSPPDQQQPQPQQQQAPQGPQMTPEDEQLVQGVLQAGFSTEAAQQALTMLHAGYTHDQILQVLAQSRQGAPA